MDRRPILVGEVNPYSARLEHALYPTPPGCSGWRVWKMLEERCGATRSDYANAFDRRNLVRGTWDVAKAKAEAGRIHAHAAGATVVLLGEKVRRAFGLPRELVHPIVRDGVTYRQVPHPSGRCLFYNDPVQRALVAVMLEDLYLEGRACS